MTKKHFNDSLFQQVVQGVKPIKNDRVDLYSNPDNIRPFKDKQQYDETHCQTRISDQLETLTVAGEEFIFFARPGLQQKTQKQLRQGKISIDDHLDLHGLSIEEARQTLLEFIDFAQKQQIRCIRLVHGKGYRSDTDKPVLKNKVNNWLRQHPGILAFSSTQPRDGGTGAVYILIKSL